ncbi:MAG TPA: glycerophosphodiester phosphodiesterase family protein [Solirubrobacterales bacterium]
MSRARLLAWALAPALLAALVAAQGALASLDASFVQAHRGGAIATVKGKQKPVYGEETMTAFKAAAEKGYVLELDVKISADGVPMVIHDATLDRTTSCDGQVAARTAAGIVRGCPVDLLGTGDVTKRLGPKSKRLDKVPTLARFLRFADRGGAEINLEIKNVPTDPDFDSGSTYATTVAQAIRASGFPPKRLIVQSFWPANLDVIQADPYFDRAETALLTLHDLNNAGGPAAASTAGYDWVSPEWPIDRAYVEEAHGLGLRVVPYTINTRADVAAATRFGVDAVITDDPGMARRAAAGAG